MAQKIKKVSYGCSKLKKLLALYNNFSLNVCYFEYGQLKSHIVNLFYLTAKKYRFIYDHTLGNAGCITSAITTAYFARPLLLFAFPSSSRKHRHCSKCRISSRVELFHSRNPHKIRVSRASVAHLIIQPPDVRSLRGQSRTMLQKRGRGEERRLNISQRISATICRRVVNGEGMNVEGKKNIAQFRATDSS